jgi:hypothetical protein
MTRRSTAARRSGVLVALALAGLGAAACTTVRDPAYDTAYAAARSGDTYCREAAEAVRQSAAETAYTGSPGAASRLARTRGYASRDC